MFCFPNGLPASSPACLTPLGDINPLRAVIELMIRLSPVAGAGVFMKEKTVASLPMAGMKALLLRIGLTGTN